LPANDETPLNGCIQQPGLAIPSDVIMLIAGRIGAWTRRSGKSNVLQIGDNVMLSMQRDGKRLAFDADIRNEQGKLVAHISHNEFHLVPGEYSYQERSDNRSKLTVYDKQGEKMLEVYYVNPNAVLIQGTFKSPDKTEVKIDERQIVVNTPRIRNARFSDNCIGSFTGTTPAFRISNGAVILRGQ
jgi:hypothetical protein